LRLPEGIEMVPCPATTPGWQVSLDKPIALGGPATDSPSAKGGKTVGSGVVSEVLD